MIMYRCVYEPGVSEQGLHLLTCIKPKGTDKTYCGVQMSGFPKRKRRDLRAGESLLCPTCNARLQRLRSFHSPNGKKEST